MKDWKELAEEFSHVTDKIGRPIDEGIFEIVVALNMLGVHTRQSCEGHLDHGFAYPWVALLDSNPHELDMVVDLLSAFYQDRQVGFDQRIVLVTERCRIQSQGGISQESISLDDDERRQKLLEYQSEMEAFSAFLRNRIIEQTKNRVYIL